MRNDLLCVFESGLFLPATKYPGKLLLSFPVTAFYMANLCDASVTCLGTMTEFQFAKGRDG